MFSMIIGRHAHQAFILVAVLCGIAVAGDGDVALYIGDSEKPFCVVESAKATSLRALKEAVVSASNGRLTRADVPQICFERADDRSPVKTTDALDEYLDECADSSDSGSDSGKSISPCLYVYAPGFSEVASDLAPIKLVSVALGLWNQCGNLCQVVPSVTVRVTGSDTVADLLETVSAEAISALRDSGDRGAKRMAAAIKPFISCTGIFHGRKKLSDNAKVLTYLKQNGNPELVFNLNLEKAMKDAEAGR
jgi:hypothetical protein